MKSSKVESGWQIDGSVVCWSVIGGFKKIQYFSLFRRHNYIIKIFLYILFYAVQVCILFERNKDNTSKKNYHNFFILCLLIRLIIFLLQDNPNIFLQLKSLKKYLVFRDLCFETYAGYISSFLVYRRLGAIVTLLFSNFFPFVFF